MKAYFLVLGATACTLCDWRMLGKECLIRFIYMTGEDDI